MTGGVTFVVKTTINPADLAKADSERDLDGESGAGRLGLAHR